MEEKNLNVQEIVDCATTMSKKAEGQLTNEQIVEIVKNHLDIDANVGFLIMNHNVFAVCSDGLVQIK